MRTNSGPVQSIDRVLDIVETLSEAPGGMALSDLAAATGLHMSTTHRMLSALADRGYACKDAATGRYRLTVRLFEIGSRVSETTDLLSAAKPLLNGLTEELQETSHLVEPDGCDVVYRYKVEPYRQMVRISSCVGQRNPLYCTAVGKSILAQMPEEQVRGIWEKTDIRAYTDTTITDYAVFLKELEQIRRQGYAFDNQEHDRGVRCVAAAVLNWEGKPAAAVSVSAPHFRMDEDAVRRIYPYLRETADALSRMMGYAGSASAD